MEKEWHEGISVDLRDVSAEVGDRMRPVRVTVTDPVLPAREISVSDARLLEEDVVKGHSTSRFKSRIFRGGFHLRRLLPFKDALLPSGPAASAAGSVFNLANATVGAGILSMGLAVSEIGIVLAPILMLVVAVTASLANGFLLQAAEATEPPSRSLPVLAYRTFGLPGSIFLDLLQIVSGFGALCAYFVLLADFLLPVSAAVLSSTSLLATDRVVTMGLAGIAGVLPLALKREINDLQGSSTTSMGLIAFILFAVTYLCAQGISQGASPSAYVLANVDFGFFFTFPMILFGYSNTSAVMPIYVEMADKSILNFRKVMAYSGIIVTLAYALMGIITYARFGADISGNVLNSFDSGSLMTLVRAAFTYTIISTYPLVLFPTRLAVEHLFLGVKGSFSNLQFYFCTLLLVVASFAVAAAVEDVSLIFGLTGSLGSALMMFFIPPVVYLRAVPKKHCCPLVGAIVMTVFGVAIAALGVYSFADSIATSIPIVNATNVTVSF